MRTYSDPLTPNSSHDGRAETVVFAQNTVKCIVAFSVVIHTQLVQPTPSVLTSPYLSAYLAFHLLYVLRGSMKYCRVAIVK